MQPSPEPPPAHVITRPRWIREPQAGDLRPVWPNAAYQDRRGGRALLSCRVGLDARLYDCTVRAEGPQGYGFGQAAVSLTPQLRASPRPVDGVPVEGGRLNFAVVFDNAGFTAPPFLPRPAPAQAGPAGER